MLQELMALLGLLALSKQEYSVLALDLVLACVENDVLVPVTTPLNVNEFPDVIVPITFPLVSTTLKLAPGATVTFVPADISSEGFNVNVKSPLLILTSPLNFPPLILPPE